MEAALSSEGSQIGKFPCRKGFWARHLHTECVCIASVKSPIACNVHPLSLVLCMSLGRTWTRLTDLLMVLCKKSTRFTYPRVGITQIWLVMSKFTNLFFPGRVHWRVAQSFEYSIYYVERQNYLNKAKIIKNDNFFL